MKVLWSIACRKYTAAPLVVAAVWFGMLLGVSFLATPAKFLAPSLTLGVALDVGRQTFAIFNKVEWLLSAVLLGAVLSSYRSWRSLSLALVIITLVAMETFWLLPLLDQRVGMIIAGEQPSPSNLHNLYIAFELAKLLALTLLALPMARRLGSRDVSEAR